MLDFVRWSELLTLAWSRVPGVLVEAVGRAWAAYSPATGETVLLNDESAAILEVLVNGPATTEAVAALLTVDTGIHAAELAVTLDAGWPRLIEAGLVRAVADASLALP